MTIDLHIAKEDDADKWNNYISRSPHGTLFHMWDWLKISEKHTDTKLFPLIGFKGSTPIGVFPLFFQKTGPIRMVFSPPPHAALPYLGPVILGYDTLKQEKREILYADFQNSVHHFIMNNLHAQYINIALPPALLDPRPFTWMGYHVDFQYDYKIDLTQKWDLLVQRNDKNQRQNMRRARKKGIVIKIGGKREYEKILDLMEIRYSRQKKILTVSRSYYLDIYDAFEQYMKIFVAFVDDEIVTGSIDLQYGDTHYSWIGNPKTKNPISPSPNDLLIAESVHYAQEHGFRYYITMNAAGDLRLHSYYASKFDPELDIHFSVKKNSFLTTLLEKGYTSIIRPIAGKITYFQNDT